MLPLSHLAPLDPPQSAQFLLNGSPIHDEVSLQLLMPIDLRLRTQPSSSYHATWSGDLPLGVHADTQHLGGTLLAPWNGVWGRKRISSVDSAQACVTTPAAWRRRSSSTRTRRRASFACSRDSASASF